MNRVYKVIWSKAKHCYVVTSEIAKSVTKSASSARSAGRKGAAVLALAALLFTAGGMLGEAANPVVTDVALGGTANVITITKDDSSSTSITIDNVAHAKEADYATEATKAYSDGKGLVIESTYAKKDEVESTYAKTTDVESTYTKKEDFEKLKGIVGEGQKDGNYVAKGETLSASINNLDTQVKTNADAVGQETVDRKLADKDNLKVDGDGVISQVTGDDGTTSSPVNKLVLNKDGDNQITMDGNGIKVGKNSTVIASDGVFAGGDKADAAKAALNADGSIKGAGGEFTVDKSGKVTSTGTVKGATLTDGKATISNGNIQTNGGEINTGSGDVKTVGGDILTAGGTLSTSGGEIVAGTGNISGKDITASGVLRGDSLTVANSMTGRSLTLTGGDLDAGAGTIKTTGKVDAGTLNVSGKATVKDLEVQGEFNAKTLSSRLDENNYTTINGGNVTSVNSKKDTDDGKTYTSSSKLTEKGRTDTAAVGNITNVSTQTATESKSTIENSANPDVTQKSYITQNLKNIQQGIQNGAKSSTVNQTETGIKSTATDGKNTASTNLSNGGFNTYATDGTNKTYTKQTATDIKNTAKNGTISNSAKDLVNTASENMTNNVGKNLETTVGGEMKTTVTGKTTENYNGGLETTVNGEEKHTVNGKQTNIITGDQVNTIGGKLTSTVTGDVTEDYKSNLSTTVGGKQTTTVTGDSSLSANNITNIATKKLSNSAAEIENTASTSITDKVGGNTTWKMTDGKISESIVNGTASNKENTTVDGTKRIITSAEGTGTYNQTATSNNISMKNAAGDTSFTKSESLDGEKTSVTNPDGSSTINQSAGSIVNFVKNKDGNTTRTEQSATDITNSAKSGTITNDAKNLVNTASEKITSQIGDGSAVMSEMTADGITNTAKGGTIYNKSKDILNEASGDILNFADGEIGNVATKITNITGDNTVTSNTDGTTFENTGANTPVEDGNEQGSRTNTKIKGNTVETGKVMTDFADVNNNLTVGGSTTLGRDGNTTLTVNSKSEFKDTVKMDKTLEVDGTSTFNDKVTITKNGLAVTGGTTTDTLEVKGTSEFGGKAAFKDDVSMDKKLTVKGAAEFKDDVSMGKNLTVTGKTETGTLHVNGNGYVGGNLNVEGNIETHDAELSETSRQVVTGRQLYQTNERVDRLDNRIKKVGANAAALAALRPGDFNPDDKFSIAAGFGSYRNASAAALGLFYRPNENVILSLGTSFGDGENMVNAGVSVKFGRGKSMAERRKEMAEEVSVMRDEMKSQNDRIAELEEMLKKQSELIEKLSKES